MDRSTPRERVLSAAVELFDRQGTEATSVAAICRLASVSNGSFFHAFPTKEALCARLFVTTLADYHAALTARLSDHPDAREGIGRLVSTHVRWVVENRAAARFLFEQSRAEWIVHAREQQRAENASFATAIDVWRASLGPRDIVAQLPTRVFVAQLIGPAQLICRAWLSGRTDDDPRDAIAVLTLLARRSLLVTDQPG
jgi:AcrR family transcriptional regulator